MAARTPSAGSHEPFMAPPRPPPPPPQPPPPLPPHAAAEVAPLRLASWPMSWHNTCASPPTTSFTAGTTTTTDQVGAKTRAHCLSWQTNMGVVDVVTRWAEPHFPLSVSVSLCLSISLWETLFWSVRFFKTSSGSFKLLVFTLWC